MTSSKKRILFLLSVTLLLMSAAKHPFYLSVTELQYNVKSSQVQGYVKIFSNDLEDALRRIDNQPLDLLDNKDTAIVRQRLAKYLRQRLSIKTNNNDLPYQVIGYESEQESTWIYIESRTCKQPLKVSFTNRILFDFLPGQMNIVHFQVGDKQLSSKVTNPDSLITFEF